jgi:6-pyruvoyltetrahydropterin/6-carboxytetrahydropterin synthase
MEMCEAKVMQEIETKFSSAHFLPGYDGLCANVHGHTWRLWVRYIVKVDDDTGMGLDFNEAKNKVAEVIKEFDHICLNDILNMPTAEFLSMILWNRFVKCGLDVVRITLKESDHCAVILERK